MAQNHAESGDSPQKIRPMYAFAYSRRFFIAKNCSAVRRNSLKNSIHPYSPKLYPKPVSSDHPVSVDPFFASHLRKNFTALFILRPRDAHGLREGAEKAGKSRKDVRFSADKFQNLPKEETLPKQAAEVKPDGPPIRRGAADAALFRDSARKSSAENQ